jgi:hypothetical protein
MFSIGIHIDSSAGPKNFLSGHGIPWVRNSKLTMEDEMSRQPKVRVRRIIHIPTQVISMFYNVGKVSLTYGSSVQVKTLLNPHETTSFSASRWVFLVVAMLHLL